MVATYLPGDDGVELHGDVRCPVAPAPNTTICDTAIPGDGGSSAGVTVTKSATPAVLVVGASVQSYTTRSLWRMDRRRRRSVSVTRCRQGDDQRSDHGDGRDASGCPGHGATSLAGCSIARAPVARW